MSLRGPRQTRNSTNFPGGSPKLFGPVSTSWLGILFVAAVVATADRAAAQTFEDHRFCSSAATNVVLYLDVTTPYDDADREALVSGIGRIFDSLDDGARLSIRTIEEAFSSSDRLLDMCVPFCVSNGFFADLFSDCTAGVVINEKKKLRAAIREAISARLEGTVELPHSEIIRTLSVSAGEEYRPGQDNRFYVFSDMIENSAYLSGKAFFSTATSKLLSKLEDDKLVPQLAGTKVRAFGFGRTGYATSRDPLPQNLIEKITEFWLAYFAAAGATFSVQQNLGTLE